MGHFDATPEPRTTQRLRALALVCRQWKYALDQSPSVWGWIDCRQDASFAAQKSREASLSINFVNEGNFGSPELQHGFATLLPHSKRWESLQICMTAVAAAHFVPVFGSLYLPNLEDLGLLVHARGCYDPPNVDYLERYPLRRLVLKGISTPWDTIAGFAGLRSLTIADLSYRSAWPSRDQIGGIILGCHCLEELTLSNLENHPADVGVPDPVPPTFYVPALRSVALNDILNTREAALWLLESITAPNLIGLSVTGTWTNREVGRPIASVLTRQRTDSPLLVVMANFGSRLVHVRITQRECRIECGHLVRRGAHRGVEISLPSATYADAWQRAIDLVSCVLGDLPLDVEIDKLPQRYLPNPDPDPAFLAQLPSLSVLRMLQVPNVEAFLLFLCSESPGNQTKYCCPNLMEVHLLASSLTRTEIWRHAVNALMEKRPDLALYDGVRRISPDFQ